MKFLSSCTDVLIASRCCFAEDGTEMYQHVKRTCKACRVVVFAHKPMFCGVLVAVVLS